MECPTIRDLIKLRTDSGDSTHLPLAGSGDRKDNWQRVSRPRNMLSKNLRLTNFEKPFERNFVVILSVYFMIDILWNCARFDLPLATS